MPYLRVFVTLITITLLFIVSQIITYHKFCFSIWLAATDTIFARYFSTIPLETASLYLLCMITRHSHAVKSEPLLQVARSSLSIFSLTFTIKLSTAIGWWQCGQLRIRAYTRVCSRSVTAALDILSVIFQARLWWVLLSPPSERSDWRRYCFRSISVCLSVCASVRSGPVNQTSLKRLKLQIWHACFQRQSGHDPLKIFLKGDVVRVTWPPKFLCVKC